MSSAPELTALVLAASRRGSEDPVAAITGQSHKCLVEVAGQTMIERVIAALKDSGTCSRILVSIESESILRQVPQLAAWLDEGIIEATPSEANLADSILALAAQGSPPLPLLLTTADNVLHTPELLAGFARDALACGADVAVGMTPEATVRAEFPDEPLGFFRFRDGGYSFCNLFLFRTSKSFEAAEAFRGGGQFRKKPWRILQAFGVLNLILYRLGRLSLDAAFGRISAKLGIRLQTIEVPYAFAPIDVDNLRTYDLSQRILSARQS
ncbi:MAG: NTP transferase domain-containing protein [Gammaproteobacteria bacterium]|nr:NTP transferase domain-containing protein [Gammaproteobacteria bacterium]